MAESVFTLAAAAIALYKVNAAGTGLGNPTPVLTGVCPEGLRLAYTLNQKVTRPTGAPTRNVHARDESHRLSIKQIWVVDTVDFVMTHGKEYVLQVIWSDSGTGAAPGTKTHTRTYFRVFPESADLESVGVGESLTDQVFTAAFFTQVTA